MSADLPNASATPPMPPVAPYRKAEWLRQLDRIEAKLDTLIKALAEDDEQPNVDLDGNQIGGPRDETKSL